MKQLPNLLVFLITGCLGFVAARAGLPEDYPLALLVILVCAYLFAWPGVVLHELGHLLAGVLMGFNMYQFHLGRYTWQRHPHRFQGYPTPKGNPFWGSVAGLIHPDWSEASYRWRAFVFVLGGPLLNLLLGLGCFIWMMRSEGWWTLVLLMAVANQLSMFVTNMLPIRQNNDGHRILQLLRGEVVPVQHLIQRHFALLAQPVNFRTLSPKPLQEALEKGQFASLEVPLLQLLHVVHLRQHNWQEGQPVLDRLKTLMQGADAQLGLKLDQAYLNLRHHHQPELAREVLGQSGPRELEPGFAVVKAALLMEEGEPVQALECIQEMRKRLKAGGYSIWLNSVDFILQDLQHDAELAMKVR
ncbi:site-2 protease family protein [Deinococcus roseus]|uniref:Peptidase M50 domain-containing protein n=1 Tax=Deinococcus roseus TaxID=392414 RepID=A0ABQ2DI76_9DEIO|nr:site-2 protease family protein [Deinococcus roseus]GGJ59028.1 hypothetical protein GCM10008938_51360 [Deinococcus roseus]